MTSTLTRIAELIDVYRSTEGLTGAELVELLRELTGHLAYLETPRAEFHLKFNSEVNKLMSEGMSNAKATPKAEQKVPELYQLRRIMTGGYKVTDAIRTQISYLKQELNTINQ